MSEFAEAIRWDYVVMYAVGFSVALLITGFRK